MAPNAISAVGLTKRYRGAPGSGGWIEAVSDVSFDLGPGEAMGLIGRNGAGKSTLLRILSRVTRPSAGHADVYGRIGALLEVGTGFHPELTGRENTYLSGAILGMSRRDVDTRFDAIVAFAEMGPFIDMPVKHYSSGMYARLGFAVAAHLLPAILIVDEVLAVGDLPFQAKCLAHMHRLTENGTSVLFVSHNLLAVADLCTRALVMNGGRLVFDGPVNAAIADYRRALATSDGVARGTAPTEGRMTINGEPAAAAVESRPNQSLRIDLAADHPADAPATALILNLVIETSDGRTAVHLRSDSNGTALVLEPGRNVLTVVIDELPLAPGNYWLWLRVVGLDPRQPIMWDTERVLLAVGGDQAFESVVLPRHHFAHAADRAAAAVDPDG